MSDLWGPCKVHSVLSWGIQCGENSRTSSSLNLRTWWPFTHLNLSVSKIAATWQDMSISYCQITFPQKKKMVCLCGMHQQSLLSWPHRCWAHWAQKPRQQTGEFPNDIGAKPLSTMSFSCCPRCFTLVWHMPCGPAALSPSGPAALRPCGPAALLMRFILKASSNSSIV